MELTDVVEWISAILVTLAIKVAWSLRQTMESLEEQNNTTNSRYFSANVELNLTEEAVNENENITNQRTPVAEPQTESSDKKNSLVTSTPLGKCALDANIVSPNMSDVLESPKEEAVEFVVPEITPEGLRYERELVDRLCMMRMPTEADGEIIRTTFARGTISPETKLKYRKFLSSPVVRNRVPQRKHLRL